MGAFAGTLEGIRSVLKEENDKSFATEQRKRESLVALYKGLADSPDARPEIRQQAYSRLFQITTTPADKKLPKDIGDLTTLLMPQGQPGQPGSAQPPGQLQPLQQPQQPQAPSAPGALPQLPGIDPVGAAPMAPAQPAIPPQVVQGMSGQSQLNQQQGTLPNLSPVPGGENVVNPQTAAATGAVPGMFITPQELMAQKAQGAYQIAAAQKSASVDIDNAQRRLKLAELRTTPEFQSASPQQQAEMLFEAGFGGSLSRSPTGAPRLVSGNDRNGQKYVGTFTPGVGITLQDGSPVDPIDQNDIKYVGSESTAQSVLRGEDFAVHTAIKADEARLGRQLTDAEKLAHSRRIHDERRRPMVSPNSAIPAVDNRDGSFKFVSPTEARSNPNLAPIRQSFDESGSPTIGGSKGPVGSLSAPAPIPVSTSDQLVNFNVALDVAKEAKALLTKTQSVLGPLWGRVANLSYDELGGAGLSPQQMDALSSLHTLIQSRAFADAGKALTNIEDKYVVQRNLPQPKDSFALAIVKLNRVENFLAKKRDAIQQLMTPQQQNRVRKGGSEKPNTIGPVLIEFGRDANGKLVRK